MVLGALSALLEMEDDIEVVARARDGGEALQMAERLDPDVVLTDIEMPQMTGLELAARRRGRARHACRHPHHLRPSRLSAPGAGRGGSWLPAEGRAGRGTSAGSAPGAGRWPGDLAGAGRRGLERDGPADRPGAAGTAAGRGGCIGRGHRGNAAPVGRDGAELPVPGDQQAGRLESGRGRPHRAAERMALTRASALVLGPRVRIRPPNSTSPAPGRLQVVIRLARRSTNSEAARHRRRSPGGLDGRPAAFGASSRPGRGDGRRGAGPSRSANRGQPHRPPPPRSYRAGSESSARERSRSGIVDAPPPTADPAVPAQLDPVATATWFTVVVPATSGGDRPSTARTGPGLPCSHLHGQTAGRSRRCSSATTPSRPARCSHVPTPSQPRETPSEPVKLCR